jgi:hypothetical protein
MSNLIEPNWKDEILAGNEKYRIRKNGDIIQDDIDIEQTTATIQTGTPLTKANLENPIGEIRYFVNEKNDSKYLLCDGSRINRIDYPALLEILPEKYIYDEKSMNADFKEITQVSYFPEKNIYIMVRSGSSDVKGFGIFTSNDGLEWILRYNSGSEYRYYAPTVQYISDMNLFVAKSKATILRSDDGINWSVAKYNVNSDYSFTNIVYSATLQKAFFTEYKSASTACSYVYSTTDFLNFNRICTMSDDEYLDEKIIEDNGVLYAAAYIGLNSRNTLYKSTNGGASFETTGLKFSTNSAVKYGEYWYSKLNYYIFRTKNFTECETFIQVSTDEANSLQIIGILNNKLYVRKPNALIQIDENGNQQTFPYANNLSYFEIRGEYAKIENKNIYCTSNFLDWNKYDELPVSDKTSSVFYANKKIYAQNETEYTKFFMYDENYINLPSIDFCKAYVKALSESEE